MWSAAEHRIKLLTFFKVCAEQEEFGNGAAVGIGLWHIMRLKSLRNLMNLVNFENIG